MNNGTFLLFKGDDLDSRKTSGTSSEYGEDDVEQMRVQALEQLSAARVSNFKFFQHCNTDRGPLLNFKFG